MKERCSPYLDIYLTLGIRLSLFPQACVMTSTFFPIRSTMLITFFLSQYVWHACYSTCCCCAPLGVQGVDRLFSAFYLRFADSWEQALSGAWTQEESIGKCSLCPSPRIDLFLFDINWAGELMIPLLSPSDRPCWSHKLIASLVWWHQPQE